MCFVANRFFHTEGFRLTALFAGVFTVSILVLGGSVLVINDQAFNDQIVQSAQANTIAIQKAYTTQGAHEAQELAQQLMASPEGSDYLLLQNNGQKLVGNLPIMAPTVGETQIAIRHHRRVLGFGAMVAPGLYVFSGTDMARAHYAHERILTTLEWLFFGGLLIAIAAGALVSRSFLRRMDAISSACRSIMQGNLKARIAERGTKDELDRLANTINQMLDRIEALMGNLHQVVNDIAHDLRTPVTHLRHRLERARIEAKDPADHKRALDAAISAADDILALFAALLRVAEIEGGARRAAFALIDVTDLLKHLHAVFAPVAEDSGHIFLFHVEAALVIRGDRELLIQLFSNLIENAIVHTPAGTQISLGAAMHDGEVMISIQDTGPGVPSAEHDRLFRPLYRRETSRTRPGHGLGLSLVAAIAELHGASISVASDAGFRLSVTFPGHAASAA